MDSFIAKYWGYLIAAVLFLIYFQSLSSAPFGDDYGFIFKSDAVMKAPNPFVYWFSSTSDNRSWPLSYSVFWCLFKMFGHNFFYYKLINLIFHFINVLLLSRILKKLAIQYWLPIVFLYAIHPVNVESIVWIFQLKTILSVTFFLFCYGFFLDYLVKNKWWLLILALLLFALSLLTKITAVMAPFIFFYHLYFQSFSTMKKISIFISFSLIALFFGITSMNGVVAYSSLESSRAKSFTEHYVSPSIPPVKNSGEQQHLNVSLKTPIDSLLFYVNDLSAIDDFLVKSAVVMNASVFYLQQFIGINHFYLVYPNLKLGDAIASFRIIIFFLVVIILIYGQFADLRFGIFFFIMGAFPTLGYFYVPYMKNSYVADHWNYLGGMGLSIAFVGIGLTLFKKFNFSNRTKNIVMALTLILLGGKTYFYSTSFLNQDRLYSENIKVNPNSSILYEYLFPIKLEENDQPSFEKILRVIYGRKLDRFSKYQTQSDYSSLREQVELAKIYFNLRMTFEANQIAQKLNRDFPDNKEVLYLLTLFNQKQEEPVALLNKLFQ